MIKSSDLIPSEAIKILGAMSGEYIWNIRAGQDNVLRMDFGAPYLLVREPIKDADNILSETHRRIARSRMVIPTGKWHLFIFEGFWIVCVADYVCDRDCMDQKKVDRCLKELEGQKLLAIKWMPDQCEWKFAFDLGGILSIKPDTEAAGKEIERDNDSEWVVFLADGSRVVCIRDNQLTFETN